MSRCAAIALLLLLTACAGRERGADLGAADRVDADMVARSPFADYVGADNDFDQVDQDFHD